VLVACLKQYKKIDLQIVPKSINDFNLLEKRPIDVSMNPSKLVGAINIKLHDAPSICERIVLAALRDNLLLKR
jgi:hypothetical protein